MNITRIFLALMFLYLVIELLTGFTADVFFDGSLRAEKYVRVGCFAYIALFNVLLIFKKTRTRVLGMSN